MSAKRPRRVRPAPQTLLEYIDSHIDAAREALSEAERQPSRFGADVERERRVCVAVLELIRMRAEVGQ